MVKYAKRLIIFNNMETNKIEISDSQLRNILQGLDILHTKCMNNLKQISPAKVDADLKEYFIEKESEISKQIVQYNNILTKS
jgi:hypothetical protein